LHFLEVWIDLAFSKMNGAENHPDNEEDIVNPWEVQSSSAKGVDYDKLISMWHVYVFSLVN